MRKGEWGADGSRATGCEAGTASSVESEMACWGERGPRRTSATLRRRGACERRGPSWRWPSPSEQNPWGGAGRAGWVQAPSAAPLAEAPHCQMRLCSRSQMSRTGCFHHVCHTCLLDFWPHRVRSSDAWRSALLYLEPKAPHRPLGQEYFTFQHMCFLNFILPVFIINSTM